MSIKHCPPYAPFKLVRALEMFFVANFPWYLISFHSMEEREKILARAVAKAIDILVAFALVKVFQEVGFVAGVLYLLTSDGFFDGRSAGKYLLRLKVKSNDAEKGHILCSILRNLNIALAFVITFVPYIGWIAFAVILLLDLIVLIGNNGRRIGDIVANTTVLREEINVS